MSKTLKVELTGKNPLRVDKPELLILFVLKHSSFRILFVFRAATSSSIPPSFI